MKNSWLLIPLALVLGTTCAWAMNYSQYGYREAFFGEIDYAGDVTHANVMDKLKEYHSDVAAVAELQNSGDHDFGAMAPNTKGSHEFIIKNVGTEPLTLEIGASTCKCTLGSLEEPLLQPGESTPIKLEWTVSADKSSFNQSAEVRTNDPANPAIMLNVSGLVISEIEFNPKEISFGNVSAGAPFEVKTKMYSYIDGGIETTGASFGSKAMTDLADFTIEPFTPGPTDDVHKRAKQGFKITAVVKPGLRQGPMTTNLSVGFNRLDADGNPILNAEAAARGSKASYATSAKVGGGIMGALSMIESSKLRATESRGGYIWTLGRLKDSDPMEYKALVVLKGSESNSTNLTIGETYPGELIRAEFGDPIVKETMTLFPITLKLGSDDKDHDLLGKNKDDFGWLWIESDNPKVSRMRVAVKAVIPAKP